MSKAVCDLGMDSVDGHRQQVLIYSQSYELHLGKANGSGLRKAWATAQGLHSNTDIQLTRA